MEDESKEFSPEQPHENIEDLKAQPITDQDAQSVKGGRPRGIGEIKGESGDPK